jgi:hypothetical protein
VLKTIIYDKVQTRSFSMGREEKPQSRCNFGVDVNKCQLWWKHKAGISVCEVSRKRVSGPKKGRIPEIDDVVFALFQERRKNAINYIVFSLRHVQRLYHFPKIQHSTANLIRTVKECGLDSRIYTYIFIYLATLVTGLSDPR